MNLFPRNLLILLLVSTCASDLACAEEHILAFDSEVAIAADGSLDVVETITVRAEGTQIRRGIYRDFPTRYQDRNGLNHSVAFEVVSLLRDGKPEPYFTGVHSNGVRVNFGNDDALPVPAEFSYVLRYRTRRQIGFFDTHDELYWNATGNGWDFRIERASARIRLPQAVPAAQLSSDAYTGPAGSQANATERELSDGAARWETRAPLAPGEGMTVVLGFPKGIVQAPTQSEKLGWLLSDSKGMIAMASAWLAMLGAFLWLWTRVGRDARGRSIIVQYEPPEGHSPAGLRYLRQFGYDYNCFSVDLVALGVAGFLRIICEPIQNGEMWSLQRLRSDSNASALPHPSQRELAGVLFAADKTELAFDGKTTRQLRQAAYKQFEALKAQYQPRYFRTNTIWSKVGLGFAIFFLFFSLPRTGGNDTLVIFALATTALMAATCGLFHFLLRQTTAEGRALLDHIEGLRRYLGVAERDALANLKSPAPQLNAEHYQAMLPYAMALDVEAAWTARFTAAVGAVVATEAARSAGWIGGKAFAGSSISQLGNSLSGSFSRQIASSASPPGGRSGGGGRGSSGGGGGGGGGGR
jgi:uncharacterized membrane protein YgcG